MSSSDENPASAVSHLLRFPYVVDDAPGSSSRPTCQTLPLRLASRTVVALRALAPKDVCLETATVIPAVSLGLGRLGTRRNGLDVVDGVPLQTLLRPLLFAKWPAGG